MKLSRLEINNFRGKKTATIILDEHNVLLGLNNSGRSTVMDAIGLLLGRDRLARTLGDYDFYGGNPQPEDKIQIKDLITGFDEDKPENYPD